jgi:general secretion pathway protein H
MRRISAFTLIEILVVLFIVSIMSGIAIVNLPSFATSSSLNTESERLRQLIEMVREEALLQANEYGFKPYGTGYSFYLYDDEILAWKQITERPFQSRELSDGVELKVSIEETEFGVWDEEEAPPILLLSSGETTPFELTISVRGGDRARTLVADGYNTVKWSDEEAQ